MTQAVQLSEKDLGPHRPADLWRSGPLRFNDAAVVWGAAAGIRDAFVPRCVAEVGAHCTVDVLDGRSGPAAVERLLADVLSEADRRADWLQRWRRGGVDLHRAEIRAGRLEWRTRVTVALCCLAADQPRDERGRDLPIWEVVIDGSHDERCAAAEQSMRTL